MRRGTNALSVAHQAIGIRREWSSQPHPTIRRGALRWIGRLQPTPVSPAYCVSLNYQLGQPPKVLVLEPSLDPGLRDALPHVYDGDRLCLYTPGEWKAYMLLALTILPWTAEWLLHYELWRATGRWEGGGHTYAPDAAADARQERALRTASGRAR